MNLTYKGKAIPVMSLPPRSAEGDVFDAFPRHETIVAESLGGVEDRRQRLARALWDLSYMAISNTARETGYTRGLLLAAREMPVAVPFWQQRVSLPTSAAAGDLTLAHESIEHLFMFAAGGYGLLLEHALNWEVVRFAAVDDESSDLSEALEKSWPVGTHLLPLLVGHLPRPDTAHETDELGLWRINFDEAFLNVGN